MVFEKYHYQRSIQAHHSLMNLHCSAGMIGTNRHLKIIQSISGGRATTSETTFLDSQAITNVYKSWYKRKKRNAKICLLHIFVLKKEMKLYKFMQFRKANLSFHEPSKTESDRNKMV